MNGNADYVNRLAFIPFVRGFLYYDDYFNSLPEEVQEQVNAHADEFRTQDEMRAFVDNLMWRA